MDAQTPPSARSDAAATPAALTCAAVRAREWDFVEGYLPTPERAAIQMHLDGCESCRREMTLCLSTEGVLVAASAQIPPAGDLRTGFYTRLAAQQRRPHSYGRTLALSALAAGFLGLALIRPALQNLFAPHAGPVRSTVAANAPSPHRDVALSKVTRTENPKLPEFHKALVLPKAGPNRLLAFSSSQRFAIRRHGRTWGRSITRLRLAGVDRMIRRPSAKVAAMMDGYTDGNEVNRNYAYRPAGQQAERIASLSKGNLSLSGDAVALQVSAAVAEAATRDREVGSEQNAAAMPVEAGFSLEVTDQVRGFSNTTRVASDVEVQGESSTIHLEADGN